MEARGALGARKPTLGVSLQRVALSPDCSITRTPSPSPAARGPAQPRCFHQGCCLNSPPLAAGGGETEARRVEGRHTATVSPPPPKSPEPPQVEPPAHRESRTASKQMRPCSYSQIQARTFYKEGNRKREVGGSWCLPCCPRAFPVPSSPVPSPGAHKLCANATRGVGAIPGAWCRQGSQAVLPPTHWQTLRSPHRTETCEILKSVKF